MTRFSKEARHAGSRVQTHYRQDRELPLGELMPVIAELFQNKPQDTVRQAAGRSLFKSPHVFGKEAFTASSVSMMDGIGRVVKLSWTSFFGENRAETGLSLSRVSGQIGHAAR